MVCLDEWNKRYLNRMGFAHYSPDDDISKVEQTAVNINDLEAIKKVRWQPR